jgi:hypothetical protein
MKEKGHRFAGGKEGGGRIGQTRQASKQERKKDGGAVAAAAERKRKATCVWNSFEVSTACGKDWKLRTQTRA